MRAATALLVLATLALEAAAQNYLRSTDVSFIPSPDGEFQYVVAPGVTIESCSGAMLKELQDVHEPGACAQACKDLEECFEFQHCDISTGCNTSMGIAGVPYHHCRLHRAAHCVLAPTVHQRGPWIRRLVGFPLRQPAPLLLGFSTSPAQGLIPGTADLPDCPGSVLPGKCAFSDELDAAYVCLAHSECRAVSVYPQGLDGCSQRVAVLAGDSPTSDNSLVTPLAYTWTKLYRPGADSIPADQGRVILPTPAEQAAAASSTAGGNATAWLGCVMSEGAIAACQVVDTLAGLPNAEACCRACRNNTRCTAWSYCPAGRQQECSYNSSGRASTGATLRPGQCQLRWQEEAAPQRGWAPSLLARSADLPFVAGAPISVRGPAAPQGYTTHPGTQLGSFALGGCEGSLKPYLGECLLPAEPIEPVAARCNALPDCLGFVLRPGWPGPGDGPVATLVWANSSSERYLNPSSLLYLRDAAAGDASASAAASSSGEGEAGGALSAGAIAGVAVGACAAAAALAGAVWLTLRKQQQQRTIVGGKPAAEEGHSSNSSKDGAQQASAPKATSSDSSLATGAAPSPFSSGGNPPEWHAGPALLRAVTSPFAADSQKPFPQVPPPDPPLPSPFENGLVGPPAASARPASNGSSGGGSSAGPGGAGGSEPGGGQLLPELAEHIAACEAALNRAPTIWPQLLDDLQSLDSVPAALQAWVVPVDSIEFARRPDGQVQELGVGASARVYKGRWNGETVAVKAVDLGRMPGAREGFIRECMRLHHLRHANIVPLYALSFSGSQGLMIMELCAGRDLFGALELTAQGSSERLFGWYRRGRKVALDVARALNFLHAKAIVHMDIKSSNVLLTANATAKLGDVGLARRQKGTYLSDVPLVGTFAWIAPEVLLGGVQCTSAVDIYSYGVLLWEICTGERPQRGCLRKPHVPEECPQEVSDLLMQCFATDPLQRPTAQQVMQRLAALESAAGQEP